MIAYKHLWRTGIKNEGPKEEYPGCEFLEGSGQFLLAFSGPAGSWQGFMAWTFDHVGLGYIENLSTDESSPTYQEYFESVELSRVGYVDIVPDSFLPNVVTAIRSIITVKLKLPYNSIRNTLAIESGTGSAVKTIINTDSSPIVGSAGDYSDVYFSTNFPLKFRMRISTENIAQQPFDWQAPGPVTFTVPVIIDIPCNPT